MADAFVDFIPADIYVESIAHRMEFAVRALRGWAAPLVLPSPRAWQAFDEEDQPRDLAMAEQLRGLGRQVVRAARQMASVGYCDSSHPPSEAVRTGADRAADHAN